MTGYFLLKCPILNLIILQVLLNIFLSRKYWNKYYKVKNKNEVFKLLGRCRVSMGSLFLLPKFKDTLDS